MTRRQPDLRQGHEYVLDRLSLYIDGQLTARERARVEIHLHTCQSCREELRTLQWAKSLLQQVPAMPVPRSFVIREADLAPQRIASMRAARWRPEFALQWATALIAILLVVVVAGDILLGGRSALSGSQTEIAMLSTETPRVVATVVVESETVVEVPVAAAVEEKDTEVEAPAEPPQPQRLIAPATSSVQAAETQGVEQVESLQAGAPITGTMSTPPMMLKSAPAEGTPAETTPETMSKGYSLRGSATPEQPAEQAQEEPVAPNTTAAPLPEEPAPEQPGETPLAMAPLLAAQERDTLDAPATAEPAERGMRSGLSAKWVRAGWRMAEIGLGLLLIGLIVAVVWMRRKI